MNKTLTVNIGGAVFNIEEDAFTSLKKYLDAIGQHFTLRESKEEIMADIESRIAELLNEILGTNRSVVTRQDVSEVQSIMGKPEDYADPDTGDSRTSEENQHGHRRFYRDSDDAVIGGVASGLSHALGWDPLWMRIIFVLLTFFGFAGVPIYIVLYLVIPAAKTTTEKLRMRGEKINVENISKTVNEGYENVKSTLKSKKTRDGVDKVVNGVGSLLTVIAHVLRVAVGLVLLIIGIGLVVATIMAVLGLTIGSGFPTLLSSGFLRNYIFLNEALFYLTFVGAILTIAAPTFGLLYMGIRLLLNLLAPAKGIGLTLTIASIVGVVLLSISAVFHISEHSHRETLTTSEILSIGGTDSLYLAVSDDPYWHSGFSSRNSNDLEVVKAEEGMLIFGNPGFRIRPAEGENFTLELSRKATGASVSAAIDHAREINYHYNLEGNTLEINPFFTTADLVKFRVQQLNVTLFVPEGKMVITASSLDRILRHDHGVEGVSTGKLAGKSIFNNGRALISID